MKPTKYQINNKNLILMILINIEPCIILIYEASSDLMIYFHKEEYKEGVFVKDSILCSGIESNDYCEGFGFVNGIKTTVKLGLYPDTNTIFGDEVYADLNTDKYDVYYKLNGKDTILINQRKKNNWNSYLTDGLIELFYPFIIFPLIIFYFLRKRKKTKQIENEKI